MDFGIDYGLGQANINPETGIRVGVIPVNFVVQAWADSAEPIYGTLCPACGVEIHEVGEGSVCLNCEYRVQSGDLEDIQPIGWECIKDGIKAFSDDMGDILITESPFFTYAVFCSPCAPGACDLTAPCASNPNNRCYCFGHDWFDTGKAPYTVYSVKTGKEVKP